MVKKYEVGVEDGEGLGGRGSKRSEGGEGIEGQRGSNTLDIARNGRRENSHNQQKTRMKEKAAKNVYNHTPCHHFHRIRAPISHSLILSFRPIPEKRGIMQLLSHERLSLTVLRRDPESVMV